MLFDDICQAEQFLSSIGRANFDSDIGLARQHPHIVARIQAMEPLG
jgi:hypothetical protein